MHARRVPRSTAFKFDLPRGAQRSGSHPASGWPCRVQAPLPELTALRTGMPSHHSAGVRLTPGGSAWTPAGAHGVHLDIELWARPVGQDPGGSPPAAAAVDAPAADGGAAVGGLAVPAGSADLSGQHGHDGGAALLLLLQSWRVGGRGAAALLYHFGSGRLEAVRELSAAWLHGASSEAAGPAGQESGSGGAQLQAGAGDGAGLDGGADGDVDDDDEADHMPYQVRSGQAVSARIPCRLA